MPPPDAIQALFVAATARWLASVGSDLQAVIDRMNQQLRDRGTQIVWRPDQIEDFRKQRVPSAAERLVRWDTRHPDEIFRHGLEPRRYGMAPAESNLETYVDKNHPSIFVSTTRMARSKNNLPDRWRPKWEHGHTRGFEYEIYAHGGIDANKSLGPHRFAHQREIAFPGGIRPEFIRSALEYNEEGLAIRYYMNMRWNRRANGEQYSPDLGQIPHDFFPDHVEIVFWYDEDQPGPSNRDHNRELRQTSDEDVDNLMHPGRGDHSNNFAKYGYDEEIVDRSFMSLTGDDAPQIGYKCAINIFGTKLVLTHTANGGIVLRPWQGKDTQTFNFDSKAGYMGFSNAHCYIGFDRLERLVCTATSLSKWEQIYPRAEPGGGFTLLMNKDDHLAPVGQQNRADHKAGTFHMLAQSKIRFGFTRIDGRENHTFGLWSEHTTGTDVPANGHTYAIKVYGSNEAFTCVTVPGFFSSPQTGLKLKTYTGDSTQQFRCVSYAGRMGFICRGGYKKYISGKGMGSPLACDGEYQRKDQHIFARAEPAGGFTLLMIDGDVLIPIIKSGDNLQIMGGSTYAIRSSTKFSFVKIS